MAVHENHFALQAAEIAMRWFHPTNIRQVLIFSIHKFITIPIQDAGNLPLYLCEK
jgi:hypothetical protein